MTILTAEVSALPGSDALVHLVTLNPDRGAAVSCVWVGLDADEIAMPYAAPPKGTHR